MKKQKQQMLRTLKNLETVIKNTSHTIMSDELEDINYFITLLKNDIQSINDKK